MIVPARLIGEGPSDDALLPPLRWMLGVLSDVPVDLLMADWSSARNRSTREKVLATRQTHPFRLLFVHRDADKPSPAPRHEEIRAACEGVVDVYVAVVPIRTTEAWLLVDEPALRRAAGAPSSRVPLPIPSLSQLENVPDPKSVLRTALLEASGTRGRRRARFDEHAARVRLADLVVDWSPLRELSSFRRVEADTRAALTTLGVPLRQE